MQRAEGREGGGGEGRRYSESGSGEDEAGTGEVSVRTGESGGKEQAAGGGGGGGTQSHAAGAGEEGTAGVSHACSSSEQYLHDQTPPSAVGMPVWLM